ncbi:MAG: hypothetical protein ACLFNM_00830 [Candidatus Woesearchaeota archaeon]
MKKIWMILALIALLAITLPFTSAEFAQEGAYSVDNSTSIHVTLIDMNKGFSVSSPYSGFELCTCATMTDSIQITNTGSYTSQYSIQTNKDYVVLSTTEVDIAPGASEEILLYINAPCGVSGSQDLDIQITSVYGDTQVLTQELNFKTCQNLVTGLYNTTLTQEVCEPFSTSFQIHNVGLFTEEYTIDVEKFEDYATLSSDSIIIPSGSKANVYVHYNLPCDVYGEHELAYDVQAQGSQLKAQLTQQLNIPQEYPFSLLGPQNISSCVRDGLEFPLFLQNDNNFTETYTIDIDAPSFVHATYPEIEGEPSPHITLEAGKSVTIPVTVEAVKPSKEGEYTINVEAISQNGDIVKELSINASLLNCYELSTYNYAPHEKFSRCGLDTGNQRFTVKNDGVRETDVGFVLYAPEFFELNQTSIHVGAHDEQDIELLYTLPNPNKTTSHEVTIETYRAGNIVDVNTAVFKVEPVKDCDSLTVTPSSRTKHMSTEQLVFTVKNDGLRYGVYDVAVQNLTPYLSLENTSQIALGKSESTQIIFDVNQDTLTQDFSMINASEDLVSQPTLVFTQDYSGVQISKSLSIVLKQDHPWHVNAYNWFMEQSTCRKIAMGLSALFLVALIVLIIRASQGRKFVGRKVLGLVLLALIFLSAAALLYTQGIPTRDTFYTTYDTQTNSTRHIILEEDRARTFDLTNFFADPDDDIVSYNVTSINESELQYELFTQDHILKLVSAQDWSGSTTIEMTATDSYNSTAQSDVIVVDVMPVEDYTPIEFFDLACGYINWGLFLLTAMMAWLLFSLRQKKSTQQKKSSVKKVVSKKASKPKSLSLTSSTKKTSSKKKIPVKKKPKRSSKKKSSKKKTTKKVAKKTTKKSSKKRTTKKPSSKKTTKKRR